MPQEIKIGLRIWTTCTAKPLVDFIEELAANPFDEVLGPVKPPFQVCVNIHRVQIPQEMSPYTISGCPRLVNMSVRCCALGVAGGAEGAKMQDEQIHRIGERIVDRLLNAEEAAGHLGLKVSTVRRLTYTRELPCVHPTGRRAVRYRLSDLEALLRMRSQPARAAGGAR